MAAPTSAAPPTEATRATDNLNKAIQAVEPFFKRMGSPEPMDWLTSFPNEAGQTFEQYLNGNPTLPTAERHTIYVQPIGTFSAKQDRVIRTAADYMESFFGLNVKLLARDKFDEPLRIKDHRYNKYLKHKQIRTGYILDELLLPKLPADAAAFIAFTNEDLYPDETMNFVFGQASLANRVGVWSLYWFDREGSYEAFLRRTMKVSVHETGHMFSITHCTKYECVMSGTNHLRETDRRPIDACPECTAKVCWFSKVAPAERYSRLAQFSAKNGLREESAEFREKARAVASLPNIPAKLHSAP